MVPHLVHVYSHAYEDLDKWDLVAALKDVVAGLRDEGRLVGDQSLSGTIILGSGMSFFEVGLHDLIGLNALDDRSISRVRC